MGTWPLLAALLLTAGAIKAAEPKAATGGAGQGASPVAEVVVNARLKPACAQASGGHGPDLACLNQELQAAARAGNPPPATIDGAARDAQTPSQAGTFSQAATAERLGKNFGHSATPYRPAAPATSNPIMTVKPR